MPGLIRDHLKLFHGVWTGDIHTAEEFAECHTECHRKAIGKGHPHTHTAPPPPEVWAW